MQMFWLGFCPLATLPMYRVLNRFLFVGFFLGEEWEDDNNHSKMSLLLILPSQSLLRAHLLAYSLCLHLSNADTKHKYTTTIKNPEC